MGMAVVVLLGEGEGLAREEMETMGGEVVKMQTQQKQQQKEQMWVDVVAASQAAVKMQLVELVKLAPP